MFAKILLFLKLEQKLKVDTTLSYASAPLCKYNKGGCLCKRQEGNGEVKCFYREGPDKCCFERESTIAILEKSKS